MRRGDAGAAAMLFAALTALPAAALPVFARRYKTACTTCHTLPPQLNPFGLAFRANGYRLPAGEARRQDQEKSVPGGAEPPVRGDQRLVFTLMGAACGQNGKSGGNAE